MTDLDSALKLAEAEFPRGLEKLIARLGLEVRHTAMSGCDGWCVTRGGRSIVHVNSNTGEPRQRFTLAHEIAHLLLGIEPDLLASDREPLAEDKAEEKRVNELTCQLLLPESRLRELVVPPLVDPPMLKKVARRAKVSELMAACRISKLCQKLALKNAAVLGFRGDSLNWKWSQTLKVPDDLASKLLIGAREAHPAMYRHKQKRGDVVTATLVGSPEFPAVFVQLVASEVADEKSQGEQIVELANELFKENLQFRQAVNGCISAFKTKFGGTMALDAAIKGFLERYKRKWQGELARQISSAQGRRYLSLRLAEWFK